MNFYYFALCHVCKKPSPDLKKCGSCKVLHYCSREHQLKDWHNHKNICKAIGKTNKILIFPSDATVENVNHFKYSSGLLWSCEIKRQLSIFEHHMWMFPKICAVCYSTEANLICQVCLSAAYCSREHQDSHQASHEKFCPNLKLCLVVHQALHADNVGNEGIKFKINEEVQCLPKPLEEVFKLLGFQTHFDYSKKHIDYIIMSDFFCPAINMVHALEKSGFIQNRQGKKNKLNVHIVGSDIAECKMCWRLILEFLSHWITNLKEANIFLIGPNAGGEEKLRLTFNRGKCHIKNFDGTVAHLRGYYHDLIHFISRPDLVIAFNSGLHEFTDTEKDTWKPSIPRLIQHKGIPTLLTAYTENELKKDIARFPRTQVKFFMNPQRNPYSNLRPIRNWEVGGEPIFYQNYYVAIITKK